MTSTDTSPDSPAEQRPRRRLKRFAIAAVASVAVAGAGLGVAAASIPSANGVIHSCYDKQTHVLKVHGTSTCPAGTVALAWNQKGPRGPRGYRGPQGTQGVKGDTGAPGSALGWATIESNGTIYTSGGTLSAPTVTHPSTGLYCITGTNWVSQGGPYAVTLINSGSGGQVTVNPYFWGSGCNPAGYNITVSTFNASGTLADQYFMIAKLG